MQPGRVCGARRVALLQGKGRDGAVWMCSHVTVLSLETHYHPDILSSGFLDMPPALLGLSPGQLLAILSSVPLTSHVESICKSCPSRFQLTYKPGLSALPLPLVPGCHLAGLCISVLTCLCFWPWLPSLCPQQPGPLSVSQVLSHHNRSLQSVPRGLTWSTLPLGLHLPPDIPQPWLQDLSTHCTSVPPLLAL